MKTDLTAEYVRRFTVPIYDVGPDNRMTLGAVLRHVQETSEQHVDLLHIGYEELLKKTGLVFFLVCNRAKIHRLPFHREKIEVRTHPRGRGGVRFYRDFKFYDEGGTLIIDAMQVTVLADAATHRVRRPQAFVDLGIFHDEPVDSQEKMVRAATPADLPKVGERPVYRSDLDSNGHVNNCVYADIVTDFLPQCEESRVCGLQIDYLGETPPGDCLRLFARHQGAETLMRGENLHGLSFEARILHE
ncbi:MAG: thioesterase [Oscillospiraceae bacterium]|jgi:acyl-ACP thioesterase|nr:thioesterase [Oscillospiraceae bacterium]